MTQFSTKPKEATSLRITITLVARLAYAYNLCCTILNTYGFICRAAMISAVGKAWGGMNIGNHYEGANQTDCSKLEDYLIKFGKKIITTKFDTETLNFRNSPSFEVAYGMCASGYNITESIASDPFRDIHYYNDSFTQVRNEDPSLDSKMNFVHKSHVWVPIFIVLTPLPICFVLALVLFKSHKSGVYYRPGKIYWRRILKCNRSLDTGNVHDAEGFCILPGIYAPDSIVDLIRNLCYSSIINLLSLRFCSPLYYCPDANSSKIVSSVFCYIYLALACLLIVALDVFVYSHEARVTNCLQSCVLCVGSLIYQKMMAE